MTAAREAHQAVEKELNDKNSQIGGLTGDLENDYGPDDVFLALKDQCVSQDSGEYTYELCWLSKTTQKSKKGGGQTGLGDFVRFETIMVDEEVGADGKGLGSGERIALKYENGQHCWNGHIDRRQSSWLVRRRMRSGKWPRWKSVFIVWMSGVRRLVSPGRGKGQEIKRSCNGSLWVVEL